MPIPRDRRIGAVETGWLGWPRPKQSVVLDRPHQADQLVKDVGDFQCKSLPKGPGVSENAEADKLHSHLLTVADQPMYSKIGASLSNSNGIRRGIL